MTTSRMNRSRYSLTYYPTLTMQEKVFHYLHEITPTQQINYSYNSVHVPNTDEAEWATIRGSNVRPHLSGSILSIFKTAFPETNPYGQIFQILHTCAVQRALDVYRMVIDENNRPERNHPRAYNVTNSSKVSVNIVRVRDEEVDTTYIVLCKRNVFTEMKPRL